VQNLDFAATCHYMRDVRPRITVENPGYLMAREPVLAAGGIVLRREQPPRIAVVRLRKRDEWVLPKGKLDNGETARDAAEREVLEETGHDVTVHEFLGTLAYESGGRSKIVHYWRMEAGGEQAYELMHDIRAVDWLPLDAAVGRLSRAYERAFLRHVGPYALENAALADAARRAKPKAPAAKKRPGRQALVAKPRVVEPRVVEPRVVEPAPALPHVDPVPSPPAPEPQPADPVLACDVLEIEPPAEEVAGPVRTEDADPAPLETVAYVEAGAEVGACTDVDAVSDADTESAMAEGATSADTEGQRRSLAQKVRAWLGRAA
jgi:8-oxo-dGTP diphosphatase